jgi:gamma-glutamyltranspeptidase / glutathione hydrolase
MLFTTRPELIGTFGAAAATHWIPAQTALSVLEQGGNAFDAAVAGGFVLHLLEPHLNGPGGEVPILYWDEARRSIEVINGQGCAPQEATPTAYRRLGFDLVPGVGLLAATVPGAFGAWLTLLREKGTWSLAQVLAPTIHYARNGFPVCGRLSEAILGARQLFQTEWQDSGQVWLRDGRVPKPGSLLTLPGYANTLSRVIEEAQRAGTSRTTVIDAAIQTWYSGFVAKEIDLYCRTRPSRDTSGDRHAGLLRLEDLANWSATTEKPVIGTFGRFEVAKCGFWSQGPLFLQQLATLAHSDLVRHAPEEPGFVHRVVEVTKLAFADRLAWYGAAPHADSSAQAALLSKKYGELRWSQVNLSRASDALSPGAPLDRAARLPDLRASERALRNSDTRFGVGEPTFQKLSLPQEWADHEIFVGDTCHIDVIDRHGNMVAATPSGGWLSSSPAIPALGFALGTRLQMAWLDDGLPNTLTPRIAPCTTLSPSLALRDGEPYMVFGTPGGDQQDQWSAAFFLRHALYEMNLQEAIEAPSFHVKHYPSSFWPRPTTLNQLNVESRFPGRTLEVLRELGHHVLVGEPWSEGRLCACSRVRDGRGQLVLRAAANPRGMQGYAVAR